MKLNTKNHIIEHIQYHIYSCFFHVFFHFSRFLVEFCWYCWWCFYCCHFFLFCFCFISPWRITLVLINERVVEQIRIVIKYSKVLRFSLVLLQICFFHLIDTFRALFVSISAFFSLVYPIFWIFFSVEFPLNIELICIKMDVGIFCLYICVY